MPSRLLWLTENYPPDRGGMAQSCDRIVRHLRRAGVEIVLAHLGRRATDWTVESREGGAEIRGPWDDDAGHAVNRLWTIVEGQHEGAPFTHVVAFGGLFPLLAAPPFAAWLGGVPLLTLVRGNDFDTGIFSPKRSDVVRDALARSTVIGAVTKDQVAKIGALFPRARVIWTPNGIDLTGWRLGEEDRARGRLWRQQNVGSGQPGAGAGPHAGASAPVEPRVLGLFGQLKAKKGTLFFLEALAAAGALGRVHLAIVGDVDEAVVAWLRDRAPTPAHTLLPFRDRYDLLPLFAAVDVVVLPSFYDGMPNVLLEAAALGIPVLGSDAGAMPDVLGAGGPLMFRAGDRHACAHGVAHALDAGAAELARLGEEGRRRVVERFDARAETQRYLDILAAAVV
ncbi:MAG TPA: glycosyltransferase family 4 protein [Polyangia bacterium]|nr:glycosyltransferase family 4 protein [Polyangia bacterium]